MKEKDSLTTILIVLISGLFIVQNYFYRNLLGDFALVGSAYVEHHQYYRWLTVALVHASWTHLLFNMLALYQLGNLVEQAMGKWRYAIILVGSLVAGSALSFFLMPAVGASVGASGMIFGLFGSMLVFGKRIGINYKNLIGTLVLNAALPLLFHNIDWHAHVGGFIGGAVVTFLLISFNRPQQRLRNI